MTVARIDDRMLHELFWVITRIVRPEMTRAQYDEAIAKAKAMTPAEQQAALRSLADSWEKK